MGHLAVNMAQHFSGVVLLIMVVAATNAQHAKDDLFLYDSFPADFFWGTATAAYQIEGAWNVSGRQIDILPKTKMLIYLVIEIKFQFFWPSTKKIYKIVYIQYANK